MNEKVGLLSYRLDQEAFDKPYSDETAHMVDTEVRASHAASACVSVFANVFVYVCAFENACVRPRACVSTCICVHA